VKKQVSILMMLFLALAVSGGYADRVLVMHAGVDNAGVFGINNLSNSLIASGRFVVVDTWDADVAGQGLPTLADLAGYDVITMTTDNRSGIPINPGYDIRLLGDVLADFADTRGSVILSTFSYSGPAGGIGIGGRIMDDYSPLLPVQVGNGPAGPAAFPPVNPGHPIMAGVGPWSSSFANVVDLRGGSELILNYVNGENLIAVNTLGNGHVVIGFNSFPGAQFDYGDPDYGLTWANAVEFAQQQVPEPSGLLLMGLGLGLTAWSRKFAARK
jgi:hypothetical protein